MAKKMKICTVILLIGAVLFTVLYFHFKVKAFLTLAITFSVAFYHFCMRLFVGFIINILMKNKADYTKKHYQIKDREKKLYKKLKVKKWKKYMPTYEPELFDTKKHTPDEIAQAMCQSEIVHETIFVLSFAPVFLTIWFGDLPVFLITSIIAALFDLMFVIMQRYNRPRIIRLIDVKRTKRI